MLVIPEPDVMANIELHPPAGAGTVSMDTVQRITVGGMRRRTDAWGERSLGGGRHTVPGGVECCLETGVWSVA